MLTTYKNKLPKISRANKNSSFLSFQVKPLAQSWSILPQNQITTTTTVVKIEQEIPPPPLTHTWYKEE